MGQPNVAGPKSEMMPAALIPIGPNTESVIGDASEADPAGAPTY